MKILRFFLSVTISFSLLAADGSPQIKKVETNKEIRTKINKIDGTLPPISADANVLTIAEGAYSRVEKPFIFIARSAQTYAQLQRMVENLPAADAMDFSKNVVVAAFAGTKSSGGYSVSISKTAGKIKINLTSPPKDAMVTQALTMPFQVAQVAVEEATAVLPEASSNWKSSFQIYKVSKGEFGYSGGFTGRGKKFSAAGTINVLAFENFVTLIFDLSGKGTEKTRKIFDAASGELNAGKINLQRLGAGSFAQDPKPPVEVEGTITEKKLSLTFKPISASVADGFQVSGKLSAFKIK